MLTDKDKRNLNRARELWEQNKVDDAWDIVRAILLEHPFDPVSLQMAGHIYEKAGNMPVAYHLFKLATEADPREGGNWLNFGRLAEELWRTDEARRAYEKALKLANRDDTRRFTLGNLAALCIDNALYPEAEKWATKALEEFPDFKDARPGASKKCRGLCALPTGRALPFFPTVPAHISGGTHPHGARHYG